jgi:hypothetical protein
VSHPFLQNVNHEIGVLNQHDNYQQQQQQQLAYQNQNQQQSNYSPISSTNSFTSNLNTHNMLTLGYQNHLYQLCAELDAKVRSQTVDLMNCEERIKTQASLLHTQLECKEKLNIELSELNKMLKFQLKKKRKLSDDGYFNHYGEDPESDDDGVDVDSDYKEAEKKFLNDCGVNRGKVSTYIDELQRMCDGMKLKSFLYKAMLNFQSNPNEQNRDNQLKFYHLANNN